MSVPVVVWIVVGSVTGVMLVAMLIALLRQVQRLGAAVKELGEEVRPALYRIQADAERAKDRSETLRHQTEALRKSAR
jgi:hypothetical protein